MRYLKSNSTHINQTQLFSILVVVIALLLIVMFCCCCCLYVCVCVYVGNQKPIKSGLHAAAKLCYFILFDFFFFSFFPTYYCCYCISYTLHSVPLGKRNVAIDIVDYYLDCVFHTHTQKKNKYIRASIELESLEVMIFFSLKIQCQRGAALCVLISLLNASVCIFIFSNAKYHKCTVHNL